MLTLNKNHRPAKSPYTAWRIASILVVLAMTLVTVICFYFTYRLAFGIIDDQSIIAQLQAEPNITPLDTVGAAKASAALTIKEQPPLYPPLVRNIFVYTSSSPSSYVPLPESLPTPRP